MSPDSDMFVLMGLLCYKNKFKSSQSYWTFRIDYQNNNQYQFFDLKLILDRFISYYESKCELKIEPSTIIDALFMFIVFGNDFLPRLEPFNITKHFDLVCELSLTLSNNSMRLISSSGLNYEYLTAFFDIVQKQSTDLCLEQYLHDQYQNYSKLCEQMSVNTTDLENQICHPQLKPVEITNQNFIQYQNITQFAFAKLKAFLQQNIITDRNFPHFFRDMHKSLTDSYFATVMPRLIRFPGSDNYHNPYNFLKALIRHVNETGDLVTIKLRNKLMIRDFVLNMERMSKTLLPWELELEKITKTLEPYKSQFEVHPITLYSIDLKLNRVYDNRKIYYTAYVNPNITPNQIRQMVTSYLAGLEWLYQYYILDEHLELSGWFYPWSKPPLIDDLVDFLKSNKTTCQSELASHLKNCRPNTMTPLDNYSYVTPNEYTHLKKSPNLRDVIHLIDGWGAIYLNKCQIKWHEIADMTDVA
jgi:5'-3' exonuclease